VAGDVHVAVGTVVSMTIAFDPASELAPSNAGSVSVALLPAASAMVPLFNASEFVAT